MKTVKITMRDGVVALIPEVPDAEAEALVESLLHSPASVWSRLDLKVGGTHPKTFTLRNEHIIAIDVSEEPVTP